jgi:hypothetical protein
LAELFADYRGRLIQNGIRNRSSCGYAFGSYSNGVLVNNLQRAAFAANLERFEAENPFDAAGSFYQWAKRKHLQSDTDAVQSIGRKAYNKKDLRIRFVNATLRMTLRLLGADRYTVLMRYFEYVSLLRNQKDILSGTHS